MSCNALHPEYQGLACILETARTHPRHLAIRYVDGYSQPVDWPNPEYRSQSSHNEQARKAAKTIQQHAGTVRQSLADNRPQVPLGEAAGQRKRTRLGQVADLLVNNVGTWIEGHRLETQQIGGSSGLRRVRELRETYGWHIVNEPDPGHPGSTDRYMLVELPEEFA